MQNTVTVIKRKKGEAIFQLLILSNLQSASIDLFTGDTMLNE